MAFFPQAAVGAVVYRGSAVLLVQRASAPHAGQWAIPGGRIRPGETLQQAAEREVLEETGVTVSAGEPVFSFDIIDREDNGELRYHYVVVDLLADYVSGDPQAGDDALDAAWIEPATLARLEVNPMTRQLLDRLNAGRTSNDSENQQSQHDGN